MKKRLLALSVAAATSLPAVAQPFSNIYFFGDSLSDVGAFGNQTYTDPTSPFNGQHLPANARWVLGYGLNWTEALAGRYGLKSVATNSQNPTTTSGNNYAQGGAQAQSGAKAETVAPGSGGALTIQELGDQVTTYLTRTGGKADPNALYSVWIGGNDIQAAALNGSPTTVITNAVTQTAYNIGVLKSAGARLILVPNVPNVALTPAATLAAIQQVIPAAGATQTNALIAAWNTLSATGQASNALTATGQAQIDLALQAAAASSGINIAAFRAAYAAVRDGLSQLSAGYNQGVDLALQSGKLQHGIIRADMAGLISEMSSDPARFGFTNIIGSANLASSINGQAATYGNQVYLFSDSLHPTPQAQQIEADYIYGLLQAPYFMAAVPESGLANARQLGQALDGRYQALASQKRTKGTVSAFVNGAASADRSGNDNVSAKPNGQLYTLGVDFQVSPALSLGMAFSRQAGKTDVGTPGAGGTIDNPATLVSGFASYSSDTAWLNTDLQIGSGDVTTSRTVTLGPTSVTLTGHGRQNQTGLRVAGGYYFRAGTLRTGPLAGIDYTHVKTAAITEEGSNSSSMRFGEQQIDSTVGRLGWQLDTTLGQYSPYAKVVYAHQFNQHDRMVTAGLNNTIGDFTLDTGSPARDWAEVTVGVNAALGKNLTGWAQLLGSTGASGNNQLSGNIGVALSF